LASTYYQKVSAIPLIGFLSHPKHYLLNGIRSVKEKYRPGHHNEFIGSPTVLPAY